MSLSGKSFGKDFIIGCQMVANLDDQTIDSGVATRVAFHTVRFDSFEMADLARPPVAEAIPEIYRINIKEDGLYHIEFYTGQFVSVTGSNFLVQVEFRTNTSSNGTHTFVQRTGLLGFFTTVHKLLYLTYGDFIEVWVTQNTGLTRSLGNFLAGRVPRLTAIRIA